MRGSSRTSLLQAQDQLESVLGQTDPMALGQDLFGAAGVLRDAPRLRRALTDPSRDGDGKAQAVRRLFEGKISTIAVEALEGLFRHRWSKPDDALVAIDALGAQAVLAHAENHGQLDEVSEQLFFIERALDAHGELSQTVGDVTQDKGRRSKLLRDIFGSRINDVTATLVDEAINRSASVKIPVSLKELSDQAVARQNRSVARIEVAVPLETEQLQRLQSALERLYGRSIHVNVDVVPEILGGMRISVGDEVIDASVTNRLEAARRRFTE